MSPEGKTPRSGAPRSSTPRTTRRKAGMGHNAPDNGYLDGQLLIAMPVMGDPRFERSVIYMCAHSSEGAMGIIVNHPAGSIDFPGLLVQLDIIKTADQIKLQEDAEPIRHAQYRRRHLPDRDRRHLESDRQGRRSQARHPGAGLCRLGPGATGERDPAQWLAALRRRSGIDFWRRCRGEIYPRAAQDRDRSRHAVERSGACVAATFPAK
jgi:hypothetical protein